MVKQRLGTSSLGCLVSVLFVAAVAYFGVSIGNHFFKFYQYQDAMRQEVRFAAHNSDAQMLHNLRDQVDSLGLPESAGEVTIQREGHHIQMESEYYVHIEIPLMVREKRFNPHAEGLF